MHLRALICLQLIVNFCTADIDMIRDYFLFKKITRVSGFCCGDCGNDYNITRAFNDVGISASIKQFGLNLDVLRFLHTDYWNLGVFLDIRCLETDTEVIRIFHETSDYHMFDHLHQWLILASNMSNVVEVVDETTFSIITDFAVSTPTDDGFVLYDLYNHCKPCGGLLNITELGIWSRSDGLNVTLLGNKFSRRRNYHGMKVKVAGLIVAKPKGQDITEYLQELNNVLEDNWAKFGYSVLLHTAEMFNFTFEVLEMNYWNKTDYVGPLIVGLGKRDFDLGYFPSILTNERLDYAAVITQVWPARTCFMFRTVSSGKVDMNVIFRPFAKNVWYMLFLFSIIMMPTLWAIFRLEKVIDDSDYAATAILIVASLCQQGLPFSGEKFASRIALLQTLIFGLLVYNYYAAAIVSSRLNAPLDKMNDSLYSLIKSKMKLTAYKDVYFNSLLRSSSEEVQYFKQFWESIPENKKYQTIDEGVRGIMRPGFAYHADPVIAYPTIERVFSDQMICELTEVHLLQPSSLGLWSTHRSHFQEITKIGLVRIHTAGIRKRQLERWTSRKPYCNADMFSASSITFHETVPIILIFLVGVILSGVTYFLEKLVSSMLQTREKQIIKFPQYFNQLLMYEVPKKIKSNKRYT